MSFPASLLMEIRTGVVSDKNSIAISKELAMKLFNTTKGVVGKTVQWDLQEFSGPYLISGDF